MNKKVTKKLISIASLLATFAMTGSMLTGCAELGDASASHDFVYEIMAQKEKQSVDPDYWLHYYYQAPKPALTPTMINKMIANNQFDQFKPHTAENITVFFAYLFKQEPNNIASWVDQVKFKGEQSKRIVYKAVWDSNTAQGKDYLKQVMQKSSPEDKSLIQKITAIQPRDVLQEKMNVDTLDHLWSAFFATGDIKFLKPIISVASSAKSSNENKLKLQETARWSLSSNGHSHYDLPCVYLALSGKMNPQENKYLQSVVKDDLFKDKKYVISCGEYLQEGIITTREKDKIYDFSKV